MMLATANWEEKAIQSIMQMAASDPEMLANQSKEYQKELSRALDIRWTSTDDSPRVKW